MNSCSRTVLKKFMGEKLGLLTFMNYSCTVLELILHSCTTIVQEQFTFLEHEYDHELFLTGSLRNSSQTVLRELFMITIRTKFLIYLVQNGLGTVLEKKWAILCSRTFPELF